MLVAVTAASPTIRAAGPADRDRIAALLDGNDLPHRDLDLDAGPFVVAAVGGDVVGAGGVEVHGSSGLLRSLVVAESSRSRGRGTALCDALEARARATDVDALYLLTTTAAVFFRERGYEAVDRATAPERLRETTQFADVCPASATCMRKALRE